MKALAGERPLSPGGRRALAALLFSGLTVLTAFAAYPEMVASFAEYDDEGYILVSLDGFLEQGNLYDDVYSQYGPFFFEAWGAVFAGLGLDASHDAGRMATLVLWLAASLLAGLVVWRLSGSALAGGGAQLLVFGVLLVLKNEPLHPIGLISLLLVLMLAAAALLHPLRPRAALAAIGALVACIAMVKVNVGVLAAASAALACVACYRRLGHRRAPRLAVETAFVVAPLLIAGQRLLADRDVLVFALHVCLVAAVVVLLLRAAEPGGDGDGRELLRLGAGMAGAAAAILLAIVALGTSPAGVAEGVVLKPLRLTDVHNIVLVLPWWAIPLDLAALALVAAAAHRGALGTAGPGAGVLAWVGLAASVWLGLVAADILFPPDYSAGDPGRTTLAAAGMIGPALLPLAVGGGPLRFGAGLLASLAALQVLHAYPVAGSQVRASAFLLTMVAALGFATSLRELARGAAPARRELAGGLVAIALAGAVGAEAWRTAEQMGVARAAYDRFRPLPFAGSSKVRLDPAQVGIYARVVRAVKRRCDTFLTLPGLGSFYDWSGMRPPTWLHATAWTVLFDAQTQQRIVDEARTVERLCLVKHPRLAARWGFGTESQRPLVGFIHTQFRPLARAGEYRLLVRERGRG